MERSKLETQHGRQAGRGIARRVVREAVTNRLPGRQGNLSRLQ